MLGLEQCNAVSPEFGSYSHGANNPKRMQDSMDKDIAIREKLWNVDIDGKNYEGAGEKYTSRHT